MRTTLALILSVILAAPATAHATTGTCKILQFANVVASYELTFSVDASTLPEMPVEFDEEAGTFSMKRDTWAAAYGAIGLPFFTVGTVLGFVVMDPGTVTGTIDNQGNVVLPSFANHFSTDFCSPRPDYPTAPTLATTRQRYITQNAPYESQGVPIDPATGELTLEGFDIIPAACGAGGPTLNGLRMRCRLNPIPNLAMAPDPTALAKVSGKAQIGKPLPASAPAKPDKGDVLTLKAKLMAGGATFDFPGTDTYVEVRSGTDSLVVIRIPAGKIVKKGKSFKVTDKPAKGSDPDGVVFDVLKGRKQNATVQAATGGSLTLTPGKNDIALALTAQGLELSALGGTVRVGLLSGDYEASANVNVKGAGKKRGLKSAP